MTAASRMISTLHVLNDELLASGEAMARSNRSPQPRPQTQTAQTTPAHPATAGSGDRGLTTPPRSAHRRMPGPARPARTYEKAGGRPASAADG